MPREARIIAKRRNENLRRRIETLLIKAHEIWDIYGVDVAMVLKNNSQYYTYRSTDRPTWPPTMVEIVGNMYFNGVYLTPHRKLHIPPRRTSFQKISKPKPQNASHWSNPKQVRNYIIDRLHYKVSCSFPCSSKKLRATQVWDYKAQVPLPWTITTKTSK